MNKRDKSKSVVYLITRKMTMKWSVMLPAFTLGGFLLLALQVLPAAEAITVDGKIREDPDLSQVSVFVFFFVVF